MAARITIRVDDAEVQAALNEAARRASDLTGLMDVIGAALVSSAQGRFEVAAGPDGLPWRPSLRAMTQRGQTLLDSGRLRQSLTHRPSRDQVEVGTNVIYAGVHQFGATIRARTSKGLRFKVGDRWVTKREVTIPPRPFLGLDTEDRQEIIELAADWMRPGGGAA